MRKCVRHCTEAHWGERTLEPQARGRWSPTPGEAVLYVVLGVGIVLSLISRLVFVQHTTGLFALYSGGAPASDDSVFLVVPVPAILALLSCAVYAIRRWPRSHPDPNAEEFFQGVDDE